MDEKTYRQYWTQIRKEARRKTAEGLGCWGRILTLIVSTAAISAVAWLLRRDIMTPFTTAIVTALFWLVVWSIVFLVKFAKEPVKVHNEDQRKIGELQQRVEPKLKIQFREEKGTVYWQEGIYPTVGGYEVYQNLFRVVVRNTSEVQTIDRIQVSVDRLHPEVHAWDMSLLHIMNDDDNFLHPGGELPIDVLMIEQLVNEDGTIGDQKTLKISYENEGIRARSKDLQDYEIGLVVRGTNVSAIRRAFKFAIDDQGHYRFYALEDETNDEETNQSAARTEAQ